jgi:broad specificity phosphatase PhoE
MRLFLISLSLVFFGQHSLHAQHQITTIILMRHAEKASDGTTNPGLTSKGIARSKDLVKILEKANVDAIYSTNYKRTLDTVAPVAEFKNLKVGLYEAFEEESINKILDSNLGKTVLIVGHSNNIPRIANLLTGTKDFSDWGDEEYDNLVIISFLEKGKDAKVTWLSFGNSGD